MNNNSAPLLVIPSSAWTRFTIVAIYIKQNKNTQNLFAQIADMRSGASYEHRIKIMTENDKPNSQKRKAGSLQKQ